MLPGAPLGSDADATPGPGTYADEAGVIRASLAGTVLVLPALPDPEAPAAAGDAAAVAAAGTASAAGEGARDESRKRVIMVERFEERAAAVVPTVGDIVFGVVLRINPRAAIVDVRCIGTRALREGFEGVIRRENVRETDIDRVKMEQSFRPGDIVRAMVVSLGDARSLVLSTARVDLGVVVGRPTPQPGAHAGETLTPVSWKEMKNPVTGAVELRKVARAVFAAPAAEAGDAPAAAAGGAAP